MVSRPSRRQFLQGVGTVAAVARTDGVDATLALTGEA